MRTVAVDVRRTVSGSGDTSHWKSVVVHAIRQDLPDGADVLTEDLYQIAEEEHASLSIARTFGTLASGMITRHMI